MLSANDAALKKRTESSVSQDSKPPSFENLSGLFVLRSKLIMSALLILILCLPCVSGLLLPALQCQLLLAKPIIFSRQSLPVSEIITGSSRTRNIYVKHNIKNRSYRLSALMDTQGGNSSPHDERSDDEEKPFDKIKAFGKAGIISYIFWELIFWGVSFPIAAVTFYKATGHLPDLSNSDDMKALGTEAFAVINIARLANPLRFGLALTTAPWIQRNILDKMND